MKNKHAIAENFGRLGETIAIWFLRAQLFSISAKRFKTPFGEIDVIAKRGDLVVFVEVKIRRKKAALGDALGAVNQRRIIKAAHYYLAANPELFHKFLRFDVILLAPWTLPTHLRGAFEAT